MEWLPNFMISKTKNLIEEIEQIKTNPTQGSYDSLAK